MNDYSEVKVLAQHTFHLRAVTAPRALNLSSMNSVSSQFTEGKAQAMSYPWYENASVLLEHLKKKRGFSERWKDQVCGAACTGFVPGSFCHLFSPLPPQAPLGPAAADCSQWKPMRRIFVSLNTEGAIASVINVPCHKNDKRQGSTKS